VGATINKPPARVYGCLGDGARCQERKHRYWRSKKEFGIHFETHLGDYETPDGYKCPACEKRRLSPGIVSITTTSFSHGRDLAMHVWFKHMVPSTTPMQLQDTSLVVKDGLQEGSTGRQDQTCYSKQGSHFQNTIETGGIAMSPRSVQTLNVVSLVSASSTYGLSTTVHTMPMPHLLLNLSVSWMSGIIAYSGRRILPPRHHYGFSFQLRLRHTLLGATLPRYHLYFTYEYAH